jgi:hypothetical protein
VEIKIIFWDEKNPKQVEYGSVINREEDGKYVQDPLFVSRH